jgi:hypothetical protein
MSLVIFSNSEYSFLWPILEENINKIKSNKNQLKYIFVCDVNNLEKPKGFDQYIVYDINNCYAKRWTTDILPNIESNYILVVHDVHIIVNMDTIFILKNMQLMYENNIDRCSLNVFNGNYIIEKFGIKLCHLNNTKGNTYTPYDVCPAIWNKHSLEHLFKIFPDETYRTSELNKELQLFCKNNFRCFGQQKSSAELFYCLGRPYLSNFKILHITIRKEILNPVEVYMNMKEDFLYYANKYNLFNCLQTNNDYFFILDNFIPIQNTENNFCIISNSHADQFDNQNLNILHCYGASIDGLHDDYSPLQLKKTILDYQDSNPEKKLLFFLGQSDIEFIYYYMSIKNNTKINIDKIINYLVYKYIEFIKMYIKNPLVLGINPTVIKNNEYIFNVNFREKSTVNPSGSFIPDINYEDVKDYYDDYQTRFNNILKFNEKLKTECINNNIIYIDLNDEILDNDMNVKDIYQPKHDDHHIVKNITLYNHLIDKIFNFL